MKSYLPWDFESPLGPEVESLWWEVYRDPAVDLPAFREAAEAVGLTPPEAPVSPASR